MIHVLGIGELCSAFTLCYANIAGKTILRVMLA